MAGKRFRVLVREKRAEARHQTPGPESYTLAFDHAVGTVDLRLYAQTILYGNDSHAGWLRSDVTCVLVSADKERCIIATYQYVYRALGMISEQSSVMGRLNPSRILWDLKYDANFVNVAYSKILGKNLPLASGVPRIFYLISYYKQRYSKFDHCDGMVDFADMLSPNKKPFKSQHELAVIMTHPQIPQCLWLAIFEY